MKILIAGGIFRLTVDEQNSRQPAPEVLLADGLRSKGISVSTSPLENLRKVIFRNDFDVVHVHHFSKAALAAGMSISRSPLVFTEHGMPPRGKASHEVARRIIRQRAAAIICLSENEMRSLTLDPKLNPRKIHVLPNPVSLTGANPRVRSHTSPPFELLFVGQLIPLKQVDRIIRLLSHVGSNVRLRIVSHNPHLRKELEDLALELEVNDRVRFDGPLAGSDLIQAYERAHALILPSSHEALPSVVSEAIITGLPVIASNVGGIESQLKGSGVLVDPFSPESLRSGFFEIYNNYDVYAQLAFGRGKSLRVELNADNWLSSHIALDQAVL